MNRIIAILSVCMLLASGCDSVPNKLNSPVRKYKYEDNWHGSGAVVVIDSCEYIKCDEYGGYSYVHHNNCSFCRERRKQELKELAEMLKTR